MIIKNVPELIVKRDTQYIGMLLARKINTHDLFMDEILSGDVGKEEAPVYLDRATFTLNNLYWWLGELESDDQVFRSLVRGVLEKVKKASQFVYGDDGFSEEDRLTMEQSRSIIALKSQLMGLGLPDSLRESITTTLESYERLTR